MPHRTNSMLTRRVRGYSRRVSARLHLNTLQRLNLQLEHSPVAVLGVEQRHA